MEILSKNMDDDDSTDHPMLLWDTQTANLDVAGWVVENGMGEIEVYSMERILDSLVFIKHTTYGQGTKRNRVKKAQSMGHQGDI